MITRTYISKMNSIIKGSPLNTGINPVSELVYGRNVTRILCYFDHTKVKRMIEDGTMPDRNKITHRLKITNAGSVDFTQIHQCETSSIDSSIKRRAASFDLIFFLIPKTWDAGKGFDYSRLVLNEDYYDSKSDWWGNRLTSTDGCNWYQARNGVKWDEEGVYSNDTLSAEYDNFSSTYGSKIIFARQRFDIGSESIDIDITDIFNKFIDGELENNGIGIAFTPALERLGTDKYSELSHFENYIGFFTNHTNLFFEPFVETQYHDYIDDDRANFVLNKSNKLYLYCNLGGTLTDLDELPAVTITDDNGDIVLDSEGNEMKDIVPNHFSKGVYYINIKIEGREPDTMLYDTWDNIIYDGTKFDAVELDFTLKKPSMFFNIGNRLEDNTRFIPDVSGINTEENIKRGDIRKLKITTRKEYATDDYQLINSIETRLYIKDGTREIDVFEWERVNKTFLETYMVIDTNILIPQRYFLDVKIRYGMEEIIHHDVVHFNIVDDLNNKYA